MRNKKLKYIFVFTLLIIFIYEFSSSYSSRTIDNLAYVIAIGVDVSDSNKMKVSFQFTKNSSLSSSSSSSEDSTFVVNTVDSSSIDTAINLMNIYVGKELNLAHCKVIIFSEEFAKNGLSSEIYTLINNTQLRPSTNVIISRCEANYYIENSKPSLEKLVTRYYDIFPNSSKYTGYTANVTIGDFFNKMISNTSQSTAILGGENKENDINSKNDANAISGESSIIGKRGTENIGLAIFNGDKLIGELNAIETLCHLLTTNDVSIFLISIPNPNDPTKSIDLSVCPRKKSKISVDIKNGTPYISLDVYLTAAVMTVDNNVDYLNDANLKSLSSHANSYMESNISNYLYKTSKELKCDIDDFGRKAITNFLTEDDWKNYNWLDTYKDAFFNVHVDTIVESNQLLTET